VFAIPPAAKRCVSEASQKRCYVLLQIRGKSVFDRRTSDSSSMGHVDNNATNKEITIKVFFLLTGTVFVNINKK